jgi:hypothetical protein
MIGGIVGYTYQAENLCPTDTFKAMRANGITVQRGRPHEDAIRKAAEKLGIDYDNEHSYDSGDFPKPVTEQQCGTELTELPDGERGSISDEQCTAVGCGKWLKLGEKSPSEAGLTRWVRDEHELPQALARQVAGRLREWGLSHPEFIDNDNVKQAAAQFPHEFRTVQFVGNPIRVVDWSTPQHPDDWCFHCGLLYEAHRFTCDVCNAEVSAIDRHRHTIRVKGQMALR